MNTIIFLYRVAGLGQETAEKYELYSVHFDKPTLIISDNNSGIAAFVNTDKIEHDVIPSSKAIQRFTTPKGNSVGEVSELHQELKDLIRVKHGVSTRHLSGYLAWISYLKKTSYTIERSEMVEYIFNDLFAAKGTYPVKDIQKAISQFHCMMHTLNIAMAYLDIKRNLLYQHLFG